MSYDYSENSLVQDSAGNLLQNELGWEVAYAYNTEKLGVDGTFGRKSYREIPFSLEGKTYPFAFHLRNRKS